MRDFNAPLGAVNEFKDMINTSRSRTSKQIQQQPQDCLWSVQYVGTQADLFFIPHEAVIKNQLIPFEGKTSKHKLDTFKILHILFLINITFMIALHLVLMFNK